MRRSLAGAALAVGLVLAAFQAQALEGKLVVVTSYPPDTTNTFKQAFEAENPGLQVEMLKKKTTAGIKYLQETRRPCRVCPGPSPGT